MLGITPMQPQYNILYDEEQYDKAAGICMFPENGRELFAQVPSKFHSASLHSRNFINIISRRWYVVLGTLSVEALLSSKYTVGYFHRAIAQSGCLKLVYMENTELRNAALDFGRKYFKVETDEQLKSALMTKSVE